MGDIHCGTGDLEDTGETRSLPDQQPLLYNGCVILTLSTGTACWGSGFDYRACGPAFALNGLQVPAEDYELPLHQVLDPPEVRRFLCFNSCRFLIFLLCALYVLAWCALFSTFHLFLHSFIEEHIILSCLGFSTAAVIFTGVVALFLWHSRDQIIMNSDVRLMRANEKLRHHQLLVGLSDYVEKCTGRLQLTFCFFDVGDCLQRLTQLLEGSPDSQNPLQAKMHQKLGQFCILVTEGGPNLLQAVVVEEKDSEETPLLGRSRAGEESHEAAGRPRSALARTVALSLIPGGTPQEAASQLLTLYSPVYARLLGACQLPHTLHSLHARQAAVPCLCQHIESCLAHHCFP
ncbi:transmembrane protein 268 isoform X2 [Microcaecilia unicolor]|uniref:Transmembrane protein 268-like isoform X2 n=1 Tax=Microcaecilia unicolor TaxID=1415580 RepID=A0A6P7XKX8_9AMPH|nr:transmembrane protein 268-like isoform X2 [Microcaecilia unicolor]